MKFLKATAMALVVGAGMALVSTQARAQDSTSTYTTSTSGNTEDNSFEGGLTSFQLSATETSGDAIAHAESNAIDGTENFSRSEAGGTVTGAQSSDQFASPYGACNLFGCGGSAFDFVLNGDSSTTDNGTSKSLALNYVKLWVDVSHSETQGSATTSGTTSTGTSVAGLFVFGQTTAVSENGLLADAAPIAPVVLVSTGDFNGDGGYVALNQVAGVGNQQGNNLSTLLEVSGANSTTAGSNSVNVEGNQTLADAGTIAGAYGSGGESATIQSDAFQNISGAVAFNQAAGVANQQVNNLTLAH